MAVMLFGLSGVTVAAVGKSWTEEERKEWSSSAAIAWSSRRSAREIEESGGNPEAAQSLRVVAEKADADSMKHVPAWLNDILDELEIDDGN